MRIEGDRVRALEAGQGPPSALGEDEEPAVGAVHVEPQAVLARDVGAGPGGVHRAGVGGAGIGDDQERGQAGRRDPRPPGGRSPPRECSTARRSGTARTLAGGKPASRAAFWDGVVRLVGDVEDAGQEALGQPLAPGGDEGDQVGHRPAGGEQAERGRG